MSINVKKIFLMIAVLGFAGQSFASREARASFSPTKVRRQNSIRNLPAPVAQTKKEKSASSWRMGMNERRTDFGGPTQVRR